MIDHKEMEAVAAGRTKTYAVLSALYSVAPSGALAEMICEGGLVQENGQRSLNAAANDLTAFFREAASKGLLDNELTAEHTRLFSLPSGVIPHESFYLDEKKRLGGRVTIGVRQYYQDAGAQLTKECLDLPDHIGVELEFMKFLCEIEEQFWKESNLEGLRKSLQFQNHFLAEHLLLWYEVLCGRILEEAKLDLYRALARLTIEFLNSEREFVPELTKEIDPEWENSCALKN